jgi:hypothetical protein
LGRRFVFHKELPKNRQAVLKTDEPCS